MNTQITDTFSPAMAEKDSLTKLLTRARKDLKSLKTIVTHDSASIREHMKKESYLQHRLDVCHLAKDLAKDLKRKCHTKVWTECLPQ